MREKRLWFLVVLLAVVVLLNLPPVASLRLSAGIRDGMEPFQHVLSRVFSRTGRYLSRLGRTETLLRERHDLEVQVAELRHEMRGLRHFEAENEELRRHLGFSILSPQRLLLCEVLTRGDMTGWWQTMRLNKGISDGVLSGMAVMTTDGLVGRTIEVSERTSDVLLITDPNCRVACKVERSGAFGILRGAGVILGGRPELEMLASVRPAQMNYISTGHDVEVGDVVRTSGLGGVFPGGLPVGRVSAVQLHESGLYRQVDVVPGADMRSIRYVFVVME